MGPEPANSSMSNSHDVPKFENAQDVLQWRRDISERVDTIRIAAEKGPDKKYKTMFAILGRLLVERGLPPAQKSIIEEAQAKGRIDFRQDAQIQAVQEVVDLIAVDPPIAMVNRLISSFNKVSSCRRKKAEDLVAFVDCFRGLASQHLIHAGFEPSTHIGEVLAITLINNANLPEDTLHNAVLQLLSQAQARAAQGQLPVAGGLVPFTVIEKLRNCFDSLVKTMDPVELPEGPEEMKNLFQEHRAKVKEVSDEMALQMVRLPVQKGDSKPENIKAIAKPAAPRIVLHLDDAVSVLYSLSSATKQASGEFSRNDLEAMVQQRVHKALLSFGVGVGDQKNASDAQPGSSGNKNKKNKRKRSSSSKSTPTHGGSGSEPSSKRKNQSTMRGFCFDCGSKTHYRGSKDCNFSGGETFLERMNRLEKETSQKKEGDAFFRRGSTPSKGNQA